MSSNADAVLDYQPSPRRTLLKRLGPAAPLALFVGTFPPIGGFILIGFISRLAPWLRAHPAAGPLVYLMGAVLLTGLALMPTYAFAILAGWTFSFVLGLPLSMAAFTLAALLAYAAASVAAGDRVLALVRDHPKWEAVRQSLLASGRARSLWIQTLLRLPPLAPFASVNFVLATTRAPLGTFLLATLIGMAPRTAVAVFAAAHAASLDFKSKGQAWTFIAGTAISLFSIALLGHYATRAARRATAQLPVPPDHHS